MPGGDASDRGAIERVTLEVYALLARRPLRIRSAVPSLVMPIESSLVDAVVGSRTLVIDRSACAILPARAVATVRTVAGSPTSRIAILGMRPAADVAAETDYAALGFSRARLERWRARPQLLPRTVWLHELVHRYVFERYSLGRHDNLATRFLEIEIVKELYFLFRDREAGADRATIATRPSRTVERAVAWIEAHVFEPWSVGELAASCGASESTLLRAFRRDLGRTPSAYGRARRLDEALVLLRAGRHSVAEVAAAVGYDNPTAFGHAFAQRFGQPPSMFRPKRPVRTSP
jgi:AraC-like DNA-binding protein